MVVAFAASLSAQAQVTPFPASFHVRDIATNGAVIHVREGGKGTAVVLLHGFGDTGDMWEPLAAELARDHTVIVPDLRGFGLSSHPDQGYDSEIRPRTSSASWTHWASITRRSSRTTSAIWSHSRSRSGIPSG